MKKILFTLTFFISCFCYAQNFDWVRPNPVNYNMNPSYVHTRICPAPGNTLWEARMDSAAIAFGADLHGKQMLENLDASGTLISSLTLGPEVFIDDMICDPNGRLYIAGTFMNTLFIGNADTLSNTQPGLNADPFIICLDANGGLVWKRNLGTVPINSIRITSLALSPSGVVHYALNGWSWGAIVGLDNSGQDAGQVVIDGANTIGDFGFDPWGNIFVSGATGLTNFSIGSFSTFAPEAYMIYIARINTSGQASWVHFGHDVTFQFPNVETDGLGNAYVAATLMDTLTWGNFHLNGPDWSYDFWLVKIDSSGNFIWAKENNPPIGSGLGDFQQGKNRFIASDQAGNIMMCGNLRGTINWGNGLVISNSPVSQTNLHAVLFDPMGNALWAKNVSGTAFKEMNDVIHLNGHWYACGNHNTDSNILFDALSINFPDPQNSFVTRIGTTGTTGIPQEEMNSSTAPLYPNPSRDFTGIPEHWLTGGPLEIFNAEGTLIQRFLPKQKIISLAGLSSGMYLLRCQGETQRLVIE
ncbi:MAG: T9SS type A sorting domain-containing protein [Bacteroidia bacterium]|nr:T9SS type A sorting domain-containing protein [Bacteroidia bacterium]